MKRRGLGSIYRRGNVFWIAYYANGKLVRESSRSEKMADAKQLLRQRLGELSRGRLVGPTEGRLTFEEMARDFLRDYEVTGKRSLASARLSVRHLSEFFSGMRALEITTPLVREYVERRQKAGAANASVNRELAALKRMFSLAIQAGKLSSRPYIPMLEEENARQGFVDHETALRILGELPEPYRDYVEFLYLSGWRKSEASALEWRDVDCEGRVVRLRPELAKNKDGRVLPLAGELETLFERRRKARRLDSPYVFHVEGRKIGDFRKVWRRAKTRAGVPGLLLHDFRRTAVRNLVRAGVPERVAMAISGHKTRSVFDRYNIVSEADLREATLRVSEHLRHTGGRVRYLEEASS